MEKQDAMFNVKLRTRYSETGQDGIIHHSAYVIYLEEARVEFFKSIGCDINVLEKEEIFCPVVDLSMKYLKPLYSLQEIVVQVSVLSSSKVRFVLEYQIFREGSCVATGTTSHCFTNGAFKPIPIPVKLGLAQPLNASL
ncbi:MAG: acyl-CoA thioesterase [Rhabdochlamydiaceae bacterium]|nr:acyl-CoA thioesterase [Rhabdochlamydiaceae bacterium]